MVQTGPPQPLENYFQQVFTITIATVNYRAMHNLRHSIRLSYSDNLIRLTSVCYAVVCIYYCAYAQPALICAYRYAYA